jgi:hypothetical protein
MLSCRETTQLISESMERKLPLRRRMAVAIHLLMCRFCSRYLKQLRFMEKAVEHLVDTEKEGNPPETTDTCLSPEARERIKLSLRREIHQ